jgi:hypothetical protein
MAFFPERREETRGRFFEGFAAKKGVQFPFFAATGR